MKHFTLCCVVAMGMCHGVAAGELDAAKKVGMAYLSEWKQGEICQAIDKYWDMGELARGIAGDDYTRMAVDDKNYVMSLARIHMKVVQRMPGLQDVVSGCTFTFKDVKKEASGEFTMSFIMQMGPTAEPVTNAIMLKKVGEHMKIVDVLHEGKGLRSQLAPVYRRIKDEGGTLIRWYENLVGEAIQKSQSMRKGPG